MGGTATDVYQQPFCLGDFQVHPGINQIDGPAGKVSVEPKVMAVMLKLAARAGELVTREEFLDTIWSSEYGGDESLTRAVSLLRKALDDSRGGHAIIETVPRRGYRLLTNPVPGGRRSRPRPENPGAYRWVAGLVVTATLVAGVFLIQQIWSAREEALPSISASKATPVIAVLPFDSHSPEQDDRYLAQGLADETLSALTRDNTVSVIAGNSSFQFKGEEKADLARISDELQASHIVDGSVRRSTTGIRISVHLVDTGTGLTVWSEVFEREEPQLASLPGIVSSSVLASLGKNTQAAAGSMARVPNATAYRHYLKAQGLLRELTMPAVQQSIGLLEEAVRLDPELAQAWAKLSLARLYVMTIDPGRETSGFRNRDPAHRLSSARNDARRALAIDDSLIEARLAQVIIDYRSRVLTLNMAEQGLRSLLELDPDHPEVNMRNGMMMIELGRFKESIAMFEQSVRLDPLSSQSGGLYIQALQHAGRLAEAEQSIVSGICPGYPVNFIRLERALVTEDYTEARNWLEDITHFASFGPHGAVFQVGQSGLREEPLYDLLTRLVTMAENGAPGSDPGLSQELMNAADEGQILHFYATLLLAAAGVKEPVFEAVLERLAVDDLFFRGALFRDSLAGLREDPRVMRWFEASGHLDYWLEHDQWPDFCSDESLPYNCRDAAERYLDSRLAAETRS